eukprot:Gb_27394 [translate_table: standard]
MVVVETVSWPAKITAISRSRICSSVSLDLTCPSSSSLSSIASISLYCTVLHSLLSSSTCLSILKMFLLA